MLAGLVVSSVFCSPAGAAAREPDLPARGDTFVAASIGEPTTLIPILASDSASADVCGLLFNGLLKYDRDLQLIGDLAERWEIRSNGLEILFFLRKDVRWHDGVPFTAEDVEFTYKCLIDPSVRTPYRGDFERVQSLEVVDLFTVRVRYQEPFAPGLASWGMGILPKHLLEGQDLSRTAFRRNPIGTGPFRFHRWIHGDRVELKANPDYFEGRPFIDWYIYRIIPDEGTIFLELQAQGVDSAGLTPLQFSRSSNNPRFDRLFRKFHYASFGYTYMGYNLADWKFQDLRVRRAIDAAINRDEIIRGVLYGLGKPATGPFPQESWAYNAEVQSTPYDPEKAKRLLTEAGWVDSNGDGVREKNGRPFEFTLLTNQGNLPRELTAQIIQRRLAEVGIRVKIRIIEWSALLHEFIDKKRFEAVLMGWALSRDPDLFDIWHSSKQGPGEFNFIGYSNPEADKLMEEGRRTFDQKERTRIYQKLHKIFADDQPVCFLYVPEALPAVQRRFQGVEVSAIGIGDNLIFWYVPADQQRYHLEP